MRFAERERAKSPGSAPEPVTFLGRARKVTKRDPPLVSRACAFPVLLDEFGVCGTRSKNEKTHKHCELRQVLDHGTELACVTRRLTGVTMAGSIAVRASKLLHYIDKLIRAPTSTA